MQATTQTARRLLFLYLNRSHALGINWEKWQLFTLLQCFIDFPKIDQVLRSNQQQAEAFIGRSGSSAAPVHVQLRGTRDLQEFTEPCSCQGQLPAQPACFGQEAAKEHWVLHTWYTACNTDESDAKDDVLTHFVLSDPEFFLA